MCLNLSSAERDERACVFHRGRERRRVMFGTFTAKVTTVEKGRNLFEGIVTLLSRTFAMYVKRTARAS